MLFCVSFATFCKVPSACSAIPSLLTLRQPLHNVPSFTPIRRITITITMKTERLITVGALLFAVGCLWSTRSSSQESNKKAAEMEKVTGIGGVFMKARDPKAMAAWYRAHLGIQVKNGYADFDWREKENPERMGKTVW